MRVYMIKLRISLAVNVVYTIKKDSSIKIKTHEEILLMIYYNIIGRNFIHLYRFESFDTRQKNTIVLHSHNNNNPIIPF